MRKLIVLGVVVFGIYLYLQQQDPTGSVELNTVDIIKHTDDFDVHFTRQEPLVDTFMIFGGHLDRTLTNSFSDYSLGALAIAEAALIRRQHPDFHLCKSPGAKLARQKMLNLALIMANPNVAEVVEDAIELHNEQLRQGSERTCIELHGQGLQPTSVLLRDQRADISEDILPKLKQTHYYLIDAAEIRDCRSLM